MDANTFFLFLILIVTGVLLYLLVLAGQARQKARRAKIDKMKRDATSLPVQSGAEPVTGAPDQRAIRSDEARSFFSKPKAS